MAFLKNFHDDYFVLLPVVTFPPDEIQIWLQDRIWRMHLLQSANHN